MLSVRLVLAAAACAAFALVVFFGPSLSTERSRRLASSAASAEQAPPEMDVEFVATFRPDNCQKRAKAKEGMMVALALSAFADSTGSKLSLLGDGNDDGETQTTLGHGAATVGLHRGVTGMCIGEKRTILFPAQQVAQLAEAPDLWMVNTAEVPPESALRIEVELRAIGPPEEQEAAPQAIRRSSVFSDMDEDANGRVTKVEFATWFEGFGESLPKEQLEELFSSEDSNADGVITLHEFVKPKRSHDL